MRPYYPFRVVAHGREAAIHEHVLDSDTKFILTDKPGELRIVAFHKGERIWECWGEDEETFREALNCESDDASGGRFHTAIPIGTLALEAGIVCVTAAIMGEPL